MMVWLHLLAYFFGGAFLCNATPHFVSGITGRSFQTPFAKPPGVGLSSATINLCWGFFNLVIAYLLIGRVGEISLRSTPQMVAFGSGFLLLGLMLARHFGSLHGGNSPQSARRLDGK